MPHRHTPTPIILTPPPFTTPRSTHLYEYTLDLETRATSFRRLISQETDGRAWEFPQVRGARRVGGLGGVAGVG